MKVMREARQALTPKTPDEWERNYLEYTYPGLRAEMSRVRLTDYSEAYPTEPGRPEQQEQPGQPAHGQRQANAQADWQQRWQPHYFEDYLPSYNSLAWTFGFTDRFIWPWNHEFVSKADFDEFYQRYGFEPASTGEVAAYGQTQTPTPSMTHSAYRHEGPDGQYWESKLGAYMRIQHPHEKNLCGPAPAFGEVLGYYARGLEAPDVHRLTEEYMRALPFTDEETRRLASYRTDGPQAADFEERYDQWRQTWFEPGTAPSANPWTRRQSRQFDDLVSMGPAALPYLMWQLTYPGEFFALQAVEEIAGPEAVVYYPPSDPQAMTGEQGRAAATVRRWLAGR